jgi:hypothetical protein
VCAPPAIYVGACQQGGNNIFALMPRCLLKEEDGCSARQIDRPLQGVLDVIVGVVCRTELSVHARTDSLLAA